MITTEIKKPASEDEIASHAKRVFTERDQQILANHALIADTIAKTFGKGCEVVIHSLEDLGKSIVKIVNGEVTSRVLGAPITDLGLKVANNAHESKENIIGPYFSKTKAGKPLKSTTMIIRNDEDDPIGFLCINFDLSMPLTQFFADFSPTLEVPPSGENFAPDVDELVAQAVADELDGMSRVTGVSPTEKNRRVVANLELRSLFDIKGSVELVAGELGVTKHTIYKYLRELRVEQ
ncbi:MAG TPA: PAS domain-containing protein [Rectinemataceae bacterium]|nr:PAS domain-containing protein [Rectinemataceae bacterium]